LAHRLIGLVLLYSSPAWTVTLGQPIPSSFRTWPHARSLHTVAVWRLHLHPLAVARGAWHGPMVGDDGVLDCAAR